MEIRLPLRYREVGKEQWLDSATRNISRTGLLFHGDRTYAAGSTLEIDLRLPAVRAMHQEGAQFVSLGRIVRTVQQGEAEGRGVTLAVQFLEYQLSRGSGHDS
ncbi:MAG TPA: PilZ domain-containing protein [Terriglobales bacterium]|nr:PilZ domain-containing protein [Terriglobales bacterium]